MLDGRAYARQKIHPEAVITYVRQMPLMQEIIEKTSLHYMRFSILKHADIL